MGRLFILPTLMIATPPTTLQTRGCNINICSPSILLLVIFLAFFFTRSTDILVQDVLWMVEQSLIFTQRDGFEQRLKNTGPRCPLSAHFRYEICIPAPFGPFGALCFITGPGRVEWLAVD